MRQQAHDLAMLLKARDNKKVESLVIGKIVSLSPVTVQDGDGIILDEELIITYHIQELIQRDILKNGNRVCMVSTNDYSKYLVIDKVVS